MHSTCKRPDYKEGFGRIKAVTITELAGRSRDIIENIQRQKRIVSKGREVDVEMRSVLLSSLYSAWEIMPKCTKFRSSKSPNVAILYKHQQLRRDCARGLVSSTVVGLLWF